MSYSGGLIGFGVWVREDLDFVFSDFESYGDGEVIKVVPLLDIEAGF